jgi:hypothetical protein
MLLFLPEDKEQNLSTGIRVSFGEFYESNDRATVFTDLNLDGYRDLIRVEEGNQENFIEFMLRIYEYFDSSKSLEILNSFFFTEHFQRMTTIIL